MSFSNKQVHALRRSLDTKFVRTRRIDGRALSYIEGWHAVAEANRIFGFDRWDRETIESRCVLSRENRGSLHAVYVARVRITVRADELTVVREGYGTGESLGGGTIGQAHERALKMAETDATKRALATFGKPFGLGLYLSARRSPEPEGLGNNAAPILDADRRRTLQRLGTNGRYHVPIRPRQSIDVELDQVRAPEVILHESQTRPGVQASEVVPTDNRTTGAAAALSSEGGSASVETQSETASAIAMVEPEGRLLIERTTRHRDSAHLKFVAAQPCLICGRSPSDAHHLKYAQPRALGRKVSDEFTVPLCRVHHRQLHQSGKEVDWWETVIQNVDPLEIAKGLWEQSRAGSINV
jgi:hypothetical protein